MVWQQLNGNVEAIDARDRAETAGPFAGLRLEPRADFDRIGRRGHVSMKGLLKVVTRPSAGEH